MSDPGRIRVGQSLVVSGADEGDNSRTDILPAEESANTPMVSESTGDDSLQNFFKGTTEDRPLIDAPGNP